MGAFSVTQPKLLTDIERDYFLNKGVCASEVCIPSPHSISFFAGTAGAIPAAGLVTPSW